MTAPSGSSEVVRAHFEVSVVLDGDVVEFGEADLAGGLDEHGDMLRQLDVLEGAVLVDVQGQPAVRIDDELWATVQNLCFASVSALLVPGKESFLYRYTNTDGHVVMLPLADLVRLMGEHVPTVTASKKSLLPALFQCGHRFLEFLERLGGEHARTSAEHLRPFEDAARRSLEQHQLI